MIPTERVDCEQLLIDPVRFADVARRVLEGAVCVYPTETIYGIGGRCDREDVRERILRIKGRAADNPLILLASSPSHFQRLGLRFSAAAKTLAGRFWPGPLTLVVQERSGSTVAVRQTDNPFVMALGGVLDVPLFSTSANRSGEAYDGDPQRIWELFSGRVEFMIDSGVLAPSAPSTVVADTADGTVRIVREGAVSAAAIREALRG